MDSREIFKQYITGAMKASTSISELEKLLVDISTVEKQREAAKARYVIGFIHRVIQFKCGEASAKDICLNIRDIVLMLGRVKLTEKLYAVVREFGSEFDIVCENDCQVSCSLRFPKWLTPNVYIEDTYALKNNDDIEQSRFSAGDSTLSKYTVFSNYKSFEQKIAVQTALRLPVGHTLLIALPTGGGKSLVTQLLASISNGLTLVIVPTVALALDQYHTAQNNLADNHEIYCYRGDQSDSDKNKIIKAVSSHTAKLLFTSPEAILKNPVLRQVLEKASQDHYLVNVVIDEAHVIPDWGVFFRPDFQIFSIVLRKWRNDSGNTIRTYMLSATLSDDVVDTLFTLLGTEGRNVQVRCDTLRQEPRFYFHSAKSRKEQIEKTFETIKLLPKPMVIYVLEPREAKSLQGELHCEGYLNIPVFTGETKESERDKILTGWKNHKYDIVIATSAFGIGVDKPDVRTIVHACCPENLSRFYQEVGRGGRDGFPSISLFIPFQSRYDGDGDVRRALGLVNKRVLTVERSIARWNGMLHHQSAIIDGDKCILDTSATPSTMTDEEAEYAGNRNVAWNINLLLFLHRSGFIDLLDANYVFSKNSASSKKYYTVTVKLLRPDIMGDNGKLSEALILPRKREYDAQMAGYRIMSDLVSSPTAKCWGRVFKHLYPLSREVCNGCPADPEGRITSDDLFKLRTDPDITLPPSKPLGRLARNMGSYSQLIIRRCLTGFCTLEEVSGVVEKLNRNGVGVIVAPKRFINNLTTAGILLDYDEFYFAVAHCPYIFSEGVACIFDGDEWANLSLYKNLGKLDAYGYWRVLYCNENAVVSSHGKAIKNCIDGYSVDIEKL